MELSRLKELVAHNLTEELSISKFRDHSEDQREKLLWQWAVDKQLTFNTWCQYLDAHVNAHLVSLERDRSVQER
jgi:hypothetical protein